MTWEEILRLFGVLYAHPPHIRIPMNSSAIDRIVYYPATGQLDVTMTDGSEWPYPSPGNPPITPEQVLEWVNSRSRGIYYNLEVRGQW